MNSVKLFKHQRRAISETEKFSRVAYYHDMGLGKTFTGSEKMQQLDGRVNLVICQKSKVSDWVEHFKNHYDKYLIYDGTKTENLEQFFKFPTDEKQIVIINYELTFRRPELKRIKFNTVMLDESSLIQNDTAKRTKFILSLKTDNIILLSGTPTGGKYENLYSQLKLLGWNISKSQYWSEFILTKKIDMGGFKIPIVTGYKNIGRLKRKMRQYGCNFMKTDDVFDLPTQTFINISVEASAEYKKFRKDKIITINGVEMVGDTALTEMLYLRQLCGAYSDEKLKAFRDLIDSTDDRIIVFYNFNNELKKLKEVCKGAKRPVSEVNGTVKSLKAYENETNSVTLIQYQAGAMGLNLQKSNKIVYFSPPLSSELFEQSKKRTHRIGQDKPCFYYQLICKNTIEEKIYTTLAERRDYTEKLFVKG